MSSEDTPVAPDAAASRTPRLDAAAVVNAAELPSKSRKPAQRKLTAKQQMKAKRIKERDENKAKKQKQQELRASYSALTPCKTTLDMSEREPTVGDKLIVRDEYNFKSGARCAVQLHAAYYLPFALRRYPATVLKEVRASADSCTPLLTSRRTGVPRAWRRKHQAPHIHPLLWMERRPLGQLGGRALQVCAGGGVGAAHV
jgi:hypothetical protein